MFDIEYKGGNGIIIAGKKTQVVIDPKLSLVGLKDLPVKDAVVLATEPRFMVSDNNARLFIEGPGEYEIGEVSVKGTSATRHLDTSADEAVSTLYRLEIGEVRIAIIGNIASKVSEDQLESIGVVDIVIIPVGGRGYTLDAVDATTIVRQIDPRIVIPVHYADDVLSYEVSQDDLELFIKELAAPVETVGAKYKVKSAATIPQVLTVVTIDRS
jgi:L-ascorbate metabolism protein UlaG (beta-lactamase superfamily)